jgi:hypothetical protein
MTGQRTETLLALADAPEPNLLLAQPPSRSPTAAGGAEGVPTPLVLHVLGEGAKDRVPEMEAAP